MLSSYQPDDDYAGSYRGRSAHSQSLFGHLRCCRE